MKVFHSCLLFLLLSAGLHEAIAGKSSGSKRKHASDEESEDWWQWSLKLGAENKIPATVAKTNIEKAEKSGAHGFKFKGKGKKNAARAFRRARNTLRQEWPDMYGTKIPIKDPKTLDETWEWHCFRLPHEWVAKMGQQPGFAEACQATVGTKLHSTFLLQCLKAGLPAGGTVPLGLRGDAVPVFGFHHSQFAWMPKLV